MSIRLCPFLFQNPQNTHITVTLKGKGKGKDKCLHFLVIFSHVPPFQASWPRWSLCCNILNMFFLSHFYLSYFLWLNSFPPRYTQACFYFIQVSVQISLIQKGLSEPSYLKSSASPTSRPHPSTPHSPYLSTTLIVLLELCTTWCYVIYLIVYFCFFQWHVSLPESGILFYFSAVSEAFRTLWNLEKLSYCWWGEPKLQLPPGRLLIMVNIWQMAWSYLVLTVVTV